MATTVISRVKHNNNITTLCAVQDSFKNYNNYILTRTAVILFKPTAAAGTQQAPSACTYVVCVYERAPVVWLMRLRRTRSVSRATNKAGNLPMTRGHR